jgi:DNA invertase Pin-like site-specific DNA recombinase
MVEVEANGAHLLSLRRARRDVIVPRRVGVVPRDVFAPIDVRMRSTISRRKTTPHRVVPDHRISSTSNPEADCEVKKMNSYIVCYKRVSTSTQSLGLEAQDKMLLDYSQQTGSTILQTYTEVETGRRSDRPQLLKALAHAKRAKAQLVVAKLDRLARNVAFVSALMESKVNFCCVDNPHATPLTIHILAAVAEAEAAAIRDRTRAALQAAKRRGVLLGASLPQCRKLTHADRIKGAHMAGEVLARQAREAYADLECVLEWRAAGMTQIQIARRLHDEGHRCRRGGPWTQGGVSRLLRHFDRLKK